jgi:hypothetical protein
VAALDVELPGGVEDQHMNAAVREVVLVDGATILPAEEAVGLVDDGDPVLHGNRMPESLTGGWGFSKGGAAMREASLR